MSVRNPALLGVLAFVAILALAAFFLYHASAPDGKCEAPPDVLAALVPTDSPRPVTEVAFTDAGGESRPLAAWRGRGVVLNFWATWCAPCIAEMPALDGLAAAVADRGVAVLAVSADREGASAVRGFYDRHGIGRLPVLLDSRLEVMRELGVQGLPTTLLIDAEGREVARLGGAAEWDAAQAVDFVMTCIGEKAPE